MSLAIASIAFCTASMFFEAIARSKSAARPAQFAAAEAVVSRSAPSAKGSRLDFSTISGVLSWGIR
jgi:hypothetical protein